MRSPVKSRIAARATVVAVLVTVLAAPPPAVARLSPEARRVKRELVTLERDLDRARRSLRGLTVRAADVRATVRTIHWIEGTGPEPHPGTWASWLHLAVAGRRLHALAVRGKALRDEIWGLRARRRDLIATLDRLAARGRRQHPELFSAWAVDGQLITYSADWEAVAECESSGDWHIDASHDGGLQFHPNTWFGFGGGEYARHAHRATKLEQIAVAERVLAIQGPGAWPGCFRALPFGF